MNGIPDDFAIQHCVIGLESVAVGFFGVQDVVGLGEQPGHLRNGDQDLTAPEGREDTVQAMLRELGSCFS